MARRRLLTGRPLLVASAGILMGCGSRTPPQEPVGNLMAPEQCTATVCVDVAPPEAEEVVRVGGVAATERCTPSATFPGAAIEVEVSAPGFLTQKHEVPCKADLEPLAVVLEPGIDPPIEPVGNLMPPPGDP